MSAKIENRWLVIIRIYTGIFWLIEGIEKFTDPASFLPPKGFMSEFLQKAMLHSGFLYHDFLASIVFPNIGTFAQLVRFGEVLTGVSLLLGLFTRLGGGGGAFLALNYLLARGILGTLDGYASFDAVVLALFFYQRYAANWPLLVN